LTVWICPFCSCELIFTGKRTEKYFGKCFGDFGASFYACGCGKNIVSKAFKNKDNSPKTFYENKWKHLLNGTWLFLDTTIQKNGWGTPREVPKDLKTIHMNVEFT
jgi:hypothetical protein